MKKLVIVLFLSVNICFQIFGSSVDSELCLKIQPTGDSIYVSFREDELGSYYVDNKGDVISKNEEGYWVYVTIENNEFVLTNQIVTSMSTPINVNRRSVFNLISQKRTEARQNYFRYNNRSRQMQSVKLPSVGQLKILTILVQFQDVKFQSPTTINLHVSNMMNINSNATNIGSCVQGYFLDASYNKLNITSNIIGPYTLKNNSDYYGEDNGGNNRDSLAIEIINEILPKVANNVNIGDFDNDGDNLIECLHIVYAGEGQDLKDSPSDFIWPHMGELEGYYIGNFEICNYLVTPELFNGSYRGIGTICHELAHALGAPDFYDTDINDNDTLLGTGQWDLMAEGDKNNYFVNPSHLNPYLKTEIFGWATAKELSGTNVLDTLRPSELDSNSIYKLSTSTQDEYYLLENRQQQYLPGTGLVIYHVSAEIGNHINSNTINVTHRQNMYVVDADNHLKKPTSILNYGNINSTYATFRSTYSQNMYFTSTSKPSNCAWNYDTTYNKNVCFISEEMIDGEKCILFVLNPEIEGPDVLCDSAIYSLKHVPSEATIEWTYVRVPEVILPDVPIRIGSGQGTMKVCYRRGMRLDGGAFQDTTELPDAPFLPVPTSMNAPTFVPYVGDVTIKVNITLNGNTYSLYKTITMPKKAKKVEIAELNFGSFNFWCKGVTKTITLKSPVEEDWMEDVRWNIKLPDADSYSVRGSSVTITPTTTGRVTIIATHSDACGESQSDTAIYQVVQILGTSFVNPVSGGSVEISVISGDSSGENDGIQPMSMNSNEPYMGAYRLELWHDVYGKVREMDVLENTPTVTMNLGGLSSGIYILRLIVDNQIIETSQMIIK